MSAKKKILIVDDEPDMLMCLKIRLEANNFEVLKASNEEEALKQAKNKPDAILLDIMMPSGSEGYSVFSKFKINASTKDIPVIFLTRKTEDREKALEVGGSYFVIKPYEPKELLEKIASAIKGKMKETP